MNDGRRGILGISKQNVEDVSVQPSAYYISIAISL
jgi:hypothetical protein